jgi:hypothetical protein
MTQEIAKYNVHTKAHLLFLDIEINQVFDHKTIQYRQRRLIQAQLKHVYFGIGLFYDQTLGLFQYPKTATIILFTLVIVVVIDYIKCPDDNS